MQKTKMTIAAILCLLTLTSACNATIITPPTQITLEGGEEDSSGAWRGGYWTFTVAVDQMDSLVGKVVLPANTTEKGADGAEIKTRKSVEIEIKPVKSYYRRLLTLAPIEDRIVAPGVCRGGMNKVLGTGWWDKSVNIEPTVVEYYEWAEPSWEKYTVFEVSVYVEGKLVGETELNTEAGTKDLVVNTSNGSILVKNLGRLEGDYSEPHVPDVVIFNEKYVFTTDAIQYIRYDHGRTIKYWGSENSYLYYIENSRAFSAYWFGVVRWNSKSVEKEVADSPAPFEMPQWYGYDIIDPGKGWKASDDLWNFIRDPVKPRIYPEEGDDSLIWYLNKMTSEGNIASKWLEGEWYIEKKDGKPNAVTVTIPWGTYSGAPIVTFYIPSELAETFVYRPPISDVRIQSAKWLNGSEIPANGKKKCQLEIKQFGKTLSSATITAEASTSRASVSSTSITVTMAPNETKLVTFEVTNLGVDSDMDGEVFFTVKRTWDGVVTSTAQLSFILLAPVLPENTSDVVDRTRPKPDPEKPINESGNTWVWIVAICGTAMAITLIVIARDEHKRKKAKELAKAGTKGTIKAVKTVTQPVWQKYKIQLATIVFGTALFFGGLLWQMYSPFYIIPIKPTLPFVGTLFSTSLETILSCLLGLIFLLMGIASLLKAATAPIIQSGTARLIATDLMQFIKRDDKESEEES